MENKGGHMRHHSNQELNEKIHAFLTAKADRISDTTDIEQAIPKAIKHHDTKGGLIDMFVALPIQHRA